ncbi:MAG: hypothetical protein M1837_005505 [Sclerophora amabilis]|nr:MAG: hypothetical protein M1837_005505 [Sclerophora amabilis]
MAPSDPKKGPGGHYSGANPIPNIQKFIEELDKDKKDRDKKIDEDKKTGGAGKGAQPHTANPDVAKPGSRKTVTDPVTGKDVEIEDVDRDFMKAVHDPKVFYLSRTLSPSQLVTLLTPASFKTDASQSGREYKENQDVTAPPDPIHPDTTSDVPIHGEKTNILFHPTPSVSYEPSFQSLEKRAGALCVGVLVAVILLGKTFGGSLWGLIPTAACVASGIWLWMKEVVRSGREVEWESEKNRGETATQNLIPESVEWMNTLMGVVWGLINPDMFVAVADTLEDVMQASVPGVIENVRVAEISQGSNPIRILSLRALPDEHVKELKESIHAENEKNKDPEELAADEEGGDYYNIECSFAYHAAPSGKGVSSKARNMHMQLVFYLGIKGLFGVPLPIWVELQGLVGTVRIRLQMAPEPPFLKALTFTLMGLPQVQAGCIPMVEKGVNILNLPLISNFVNYAIGAAANMYVAPKSMSLDLGKMLSGDDVQKEVEALGVLWIRIHKAVGLSKQDKRGSKHGGSDPYITLSFSKYGKPMYSTRVITDDLNPIWEETAAISVTADLIKADEQLSVELWDSDRSSADDICGKVELSMQKLIQHPGKMFPQISKLQGMEAESSMPGELHWEVGYFSKPRFRPALRSHGKDVNLPDSLKDKPELQDKKGSLDNAEEDAVAHTPPDPLWPSGMCSVIVHQIVNLELDNVMGSNGNRKGREYEPAKDYGENKNEEGGKLPSSYCTILFNDQLVYRTRAKVVSSKPIFNAGTERFVRDWKSAIVTITVRDQRMRQHDPILGVVPLRLSDVLASSSQVTRWYPLDGGIGFGRIRISLLFRSLETKLPPNMLGWDVGTFEFTSERILAVGYNAHAKLKFRTGGSSGQLPRSSAKKTDEGDGTYWNLEQKHGKHTVRLPVKYRYRSPVVIEFHLSGRRHADAYAVIWLQHLTDNEEEKINIPIWKTKNGARLTQNYITEENCKNVEALDDLVEVGRLHFRCQFKAGIDEDHEQFVSDNDTRETQETWEACKAEGVREHKVVAGMPEEVQKLHERSLTEGRDVLKEADPNEKQKWLNKDGTDWSGAFGEDPAQFIDASGRKKSSTTRPAHDPNNPSSDDDDDEDEDSDTDNDLGIKDYAHNDANGTTSSTRASEDTSVTSPRSSKSRGPGPVGQYHEYQDNKKGLHRKQRGLMQWKPMRNAQFAKDEAKFAVRRMKNKMSLQGREPDVETEV